MNFSQSFSIRLIEQMGNRVIINYNLLYYDEYYFDKESRFTLTLSLSKDGGKTFGPSLNNIEGDFSHVKADGNHFLIWNATDEIKTIDEDSILIKISCNLDLDNLEWMDKPLIESDYELVTKTATLQYGRFSVYLNDTPKYINCNNEQLTNFSNFLNVSKKSGYYLRKLKIIAFDSPEDEKSYNEDVGWKRIDEVMGKLNNSCFYSATNYKNLDDYFQRQNVSNLNYLLKVQLDSRGAYEEIINELKKSNIKDKDKIVNVIMYNDNEVEREQEIRKMIQIYPEMEENLLPLLRRVLISAEFVKLKSNISLHDEIHKLCKKNDNISQNALFTLASLSNDIDDKEFAFNCLYRNNARDWKTLNNLALIRALKFIEERKVTLRKYDAEFQMDDLNNNFNERITEVMDLLAKADSLHPNDERIKRNIKVLTRIQRQEIEWTESRFLKMIKADLKIEPGLFEDVVTNKYAIIIGISDYKNLPPPPKDPIPGKMYDLKYASTDAKRFYKILNDTNLFGSGWKFYTFFDSSATYEATYTCIDNVLKKAQEDDIVYIYYSGHGKENDETDSYLLNYNYDDKFIGGNISYSLWFSNKIVTSVCNHIIVFVDACFSGTISLAKGNKRDWLKYQILKEGKQKIVFSSSLSRQSSYENDIFKSGVFTHFLIKGLTGSAPQKYNDSYVHINELLPYLQDELNKFSFENPDYFQMPSVAYDKSLNVDFPLANRKK